MSLLKLNLIAACDANMGIGVKNDLPWRLRKEMAYFTRMTTKPGSSKDPGPGIRNVVIMGRKTYDSIPEKWKPLKDRLNVVLSKNTVIEPKEGVVGFSSWEQAVEYLSKPETQTTIDKIWVIGGGHVYKTAIESSFCHRIYLTRILKEFQCDTFFPQFEQSNFQRIQDPEVSEEEQEEGEIRYRFEVYERVNN